MADLLGIPWQVPAGIFCGVLICALVAVSVFFVNWRLSCHKPIIEPERPLELREAEAREIATWLDGYELPRGAKFGRVSSPIDPEWHVNTVEVACDSVDIRFAWWPNLGEYRVSVESTSDYDSETYADFDVAMERFERLVARWSRYWYPWGAVRED